MAQKSVTASIPATGAGTNSGRQLIATPDDSQIRHVIGVKASVTTKGMEFTFDSNSVPEVVVDAAILAQFTHLFGCAYDVNPNVQLSFSLQNTTGGALAAGDFVTIVYTV